MEKDLQEADKIEAQPVNQDVVDANAVDKMLKEKKAAAKKNMTEEEKLEAVREKAKDKLDFYERVVRSVAREEAEIKAYKEITEEKAENK